MSASPGDRAAYAEAKVRAVGALRGRVLELGAGDGANFGLLHDGVEWLGLEPDRRRRGRLATRATRHGHLVPPMDATAERLPLPDASVDGVLCTITLCSVADQAVTLAEVTRVLRPGGLLAFAEHVGALPGSGVRRLQRLVAPLSRTFDHGCDPTRDTVAAIASSPLQIVSLHHSSLPALPGILVPYVVGLAQRPGGQPDPGAGVC